MQTYYLALVLVFLMCFGSACGNNETPETQDAVSLINTNTPTIDGIERVSSDDHSLILPENLIYIGAFRLPGGDERPETFAYGGNAMTYHPLEEGKASTDGYPGSLFITGHDRMAYGELPDGSQFAEVSIPEPIISNTLFDLPTAGFIQDFQNVTHGYFKGLDEIPRIGIAYLDTPAAGPKIHIAWGQHMPPESPPSSHAVLDTDLTKASIQGTWFIGNQSTNSTNGYLFTIPSSWAKTHLVDKLLATGRYRDGGWSGMGPSLFAYNPWDENGARFAEPGTHLDETVLLLYRNSMETTEIDGALENYQHADEWEGGVWLTTNDGGSAVMFAGTKGTGEKYWYGYVNPGDPEQPCVDGDMVGEFAVCRMADGQPCPDQDLVECRGHNDVRGWWSSRFDTQFIFFDPNDLARVASGDMAPWEPQPYAILDIDEFLFLNPPLHESDMLGRGNQRRMRVGPVAYDRDNQVLYLLELFADDAKPVVHVWRIETQR